MDFFILGRLSEIRQQVAERRGVTALRQPIGFGDDDDRLLAKTRNALWLAGQRAIDDLRKDGPRFVESITTQ